MSTTPAAYKETWIWEDETGFAEEFTRLQETQEKIKIGIAPAFYPQVHFTKKEILELEKQISKDIIKASDKPKFETAYFEDGALVVVCTNRYTLTWLHSNVGNIQHKQHKLKVGVQRKIPFWRLSFVSPAALSKESPEELVSALVLQNKELEGLWGVEGTKTEETGQRVNCFITYEVLQRVRRLGGKVHLGMHQITVSIDTE